MKTILNTDSDITRQDPMLNKYSMWSLPQILNMWFKYITEEISIFWAVAGAVAPDASIKGAQSLIGWKLIWENYCIKNGNWIFYKIVKYFICR